MNIERTKTNKPALWVGGGSWSNRCHCRFVVHEGHLPRSLYTRRSGHLACSLQQSLVPLSVGDLIIIFNGPRTEVETLTDPEGIRGKSLWACVVTGFKDNSALTEEATQAAEEWFEFGPRAEVERVLSGLLTYHNRSGSFFTSPEDK